MPTATVRINDKSRNILRELAAREGKSMQEILEKAIETYRRQRFLEEVNAAYAALRQDPEAWATVQKERADWEVTLGDGLEPSEKWTQGRKGARKSKKKKKS